MALFVILAGSFYVGLRTRQKASLAADVESPSLRGSNNPVGLLVQQPHGYDNLRAPVHGTTQRDQAVLPDNMSRELYLPVKAMAGAGDANRYNRSRLHANIAEDTMQFPREYAPFRPNELKFSA